MTTAASRIRQTSLRKHPLRRISSSRILLIGTGSLFIVWCAAVWRLLKAGDESTPSHREAMALEQLPTDSVIWSSKGANKIVYKMPEMSNRLISNTKTGEVSVKQQGVTDAVSNDSPPKYLDIRCTNCTRYLIFKPIIGGQGTGQAMNGLLSAHLLGDEFDRVVCVTPTYKSFHDTFQPVLPQAVQDCPTLQLNPKPKLLSLINYHSDPDECVLKDELSSDKKIVYIVGNTYPRWREVPDNYFTRFYKPRPSLQSMLPWSEPPSTVVHLRKGDRENTDPRAGLDTKTLKALGEALPSDTFLVANNVNWFDFFDEKYGWRHPEWRAVQHSAFRSFMSWGSRGELTEKDYSPKLQDLQMWSDWYTILSAKKVWHTHSDFSLSAIHWMNIESKTITGVDHESGELKLIDESWRRESLSLPLKDRSKEYLASCRKQRVEEIQQLYKGWDKK